MYVHLKFPSDTTLHTNDDDGGDGGGGGGDGGGSFRARKGKTYQVFEILVVVFNPQNADTLHTLTICSVSSFALSYL